MFFLVLMYPPEGTKKHTKDGEPAMKWITDPILSWPNPKPDDLLSPIDKVEISKAYKCEVNSMLMVDYIHMNRLSLEHR